MAKTLIIKKVFFFTSLLLSFFFSLNTQAGSIDQDFTIALTYLKENLWAHELEEQDVRDFENFYFHLFQNDIFQGFIQDSNGALNTLLCIGIRTGVYWRGGALAVCGEVGFGVPGAYTLYFNSEKRSVGISGNIFAAVYRGPKNSTPRGIYKGQVASIGFGSFGSNTAFFRKKNGSGDLIVFGLTGGLHLGIGDSFLEID